jgi:hypothetical protein
MANAIKAFADAQEESDVILLRMRAALEDMVLVDVGRVGMHRAEEAGREGVVSTGCPADTVSPGFGSKHLSYHMRRISIRRTKQVSDGRQRPFAELPCKVAKRRDVAGWDGHFGIPAGMEGALTGRGIKQFIAVQGVRPTTLGPPSKVSGCCKDLSVELLGDGRAQGHCGCTAVPMWAKDRAPLVTHVIEVEENALPCFPCTCGTRVSSVVDSREGDVLLHAFGLGV